MPQVFGPSTNKWARASIIVVFLLILGGPLVAWEIQWLPYRAEIGQAVAQPVPFSHELHIKFGLDCRYCHTSVEASSFAGMPATHTCMTCHSQIRATDPALAPIRESARSNAPVRWRQVYRLPEFVYFNHSIHIAKSIACETCHGRVDQMATVSVQAPLTMQWCLSCHRAPERFVRPRAEVFTMGWRPPGDQRAVGARLVRMYRIQKLTDCYTCHR
jgi:hypothetical protein